MLLAPDGPGLKHFRVPQHIHWPDALGHAAVCVYITPDALQASGALARQQMRLHAGWASWHGMQAALLQRPLACSLCSLMVIYLPPKSSFSKSACVVDLSACMLWPLGVPTP